MSDEEILEKVKQLPADKKQELEQWLDKNNPHNNSELKERKVGFAKGKIEILEGFDDPIEGMEEYYS